MLKDIVKDFNEVAWYTILKESDKRFKIRDDQEPDGEVGSVFTVKKVEWYQKILNYYINDILMDQWVNQELDFNDFKNICIKVAKLDKAIKEFD